ncbi:MAG: carbon-nitrogen hydrolase family protein [Thermoguttaceae bacterium]|jgi:predicted amidohydrolase
MALTTAQNGALGSVRDRLRVAAVQMTFAPTIDENLAKIEQLLGAAARRRADAVLLPEFATTGYAYDFSRLKPAEIAGALAALSRMAARFRMNVLAGSPVLRRGKLYNCLVVFDRQGAVVHCYAKCHLTEMDRDHFAPGNAVALFEIDGVCATAVICHERRYPELVRLAVMAGARILFHPNAGMDSLAVSRHKRGGRDGIAARAFENAIYYVFANSVGPQGDDKWSAGDSKIVGPDERVLGLADNRSEAVIVANLDLSKATGIYARRGLTNPPFLAPHWKRMVDAVRRHAAQSALAYDLPAIADGHEPRMPRT